MAPSVQTGISPRTPGKAAPLPRSGRPVARLVAPVILRLGVLVALTAIIGILGVVLCTRAVDHLTEDLQPAAAANQDVLLDLTAMAGTVEAWSSSNDPTTRTAYEQLRTDLAADQDRVREYAAGDAQLDILVTRQEEAAQLWINQYADPRIAAPGGPRSFDQQRFDLGRATFATVEDAHAATTEAFDQRVSQARDDAQWRFRGTILGVVVLAGIAWMGVSRARTRLLGELSAPLIELENVVQKMSRNEPDVRARQQGPREVRAIASGLNDFAEAQARARAVEHRIQRDLRNLDTAKDDFVSNVSHELRTPLTTISGYLEMVAEEFEDRMEPRHQRMLEATRRNVARLRALIDDLLTLSKAENRGTDLEVVDLVPVLREAVTDVRITAAGRGIGVEVSVPDLPLPVMADRAMLNRAFLNVLSNAVKFSRDGGRVEVSLTREANRATVSVTDHGIGIPAAEVERLGTRFFRASNAVTNEIAGTGLGVRIVQTIVDKHAGEMRIESMERLGTRVEIELPLKAERAAPLDERAAPLAEVMELPRPT
jgi:two-component system, OmpR family, sensor kinase